MQFANFRSSISSAKVWPMALAFGLVGCGAQGPAENSTLQDVSTATSFESWCESWSILCESAPAPSESPIALDAQTWTALTTVANQALTNPLTFSLTRTEFNSPDLTLAFQNLGLSSELSEFKATLDDTQWQSIGLEGKSLVSRAAADSSASAANGLVFNSASALTLSLGQDATINVGGLGISSTTGDKSSALSTIALGEGNSLNFGLTDETVQNVPFKFLESSLASALGFEDVVSEPVEFTKEQIISAAYPLLSWVNKPQRTVSLNRNFFAVAETQLKPVLAGEDFGPAVLSAISALNSFAVSATAGKNVVQLTQVAGAKLECNLNDGEAKVTLDKDFGLKRYYQVDGGIGLEFFGVKASARVALGIPLTLKRIEIRGDKITILDIPLIGKIDVDLDTLTGGSDEESETVFACKK